MCGICGIVDTRDKSRENAEALARRMCSAMQHRGPDDEGVYWTGPCTLGMRRLSIIDLVSGHQPILNEDQTLAIVCNGEIYNFPELRKELIAKGHTFSTHSDVEVALHLYEEEGEEMLKRLSGMYGLAIWDARDKSLLLARDRMGIKPLFYREDSGRLLFASELKCLLEDKSMPRDIDPSALHNYLSLNYIPAPETIYKAARKLPQGHYLKWKNNKIEVKSYWNLTFGGVEPNGHYHTPQWYAEELLDILRRSVKRHLISDVPLGVMSSGGVDSATVVALASEVSGPGLKTFSIGFEEGSYNELDYARMVSGRFGTQQYEEILRPDAAELLPKLAWHLDEPFADHSALATYYVCKLAREHVKVALSGDGGDELFAGYETYAAHHYRKVLTQLPPSLVEKIIKPAVHKLPVSDGKVSFDYRARKLLSGYDLSPAEAHLSWKLIFSEMEKSRLYHPEYAAAACREPTSRLYKHYFDSAPAVEELDRILYIDSKVYMVDSVLTKVDKMSMAVSLEDRVPLLDPEVVEFATRLPPSLKLRGMVKKYMLKRAMRGIIPPTILKRRKAGFSLPINRWIKTDLREMAGDLLSRSSINDTGLFDPDYVQTVLNHHLNGERDNSRPIWGLINFMLWRRAFSNQ